MAGVTTKLEFTLLLAFLLLLASLKWLMSPTGVAAVAVCVCEGRGGLEGRSKEVGHKNIFYIAACKKLIPKTKKYLYRGFVNYINLNIFAL